MKDKIESLANTVANLVIIGAVLYLAVAYVTGGLEPATPGPQVGDSLDVDLYGTRTVVMFTTTCSWCEKSWPRWKGMLDDIVLVSLSPEAETMEYLARHEVYAPVQFRQINTPVPVEFDVDDNGTIVEKRLGYQGDPTE